MVDFVGKDILRVDAFDKALGSILYGPDQNIEGALWLLAKRSPYPHARILSIDTSQAETIDGVVRIFTAADIPGENSFGIIPVTKDQTLLAKDKVRYIGDAVALVAAYDLKSAKEAVDKIKVNYEELPAIYDPEESLKKGRILIHEKGNLLCSSRIIKGDIEKGFSNADIIIEREYRTSRLEHLSLEPEGGIGYFEDGRIVIIASTQNPHYDRDDVARLLGLSPDKVRVIQSGTGGGFGGKLDISVQGFIGLAVYHLKRAVRMVYSREESFLTTAKRHPLIMRYKTGAKKDGKLTAVKVDIIGDTGAYASYGLAVIMRATVHATGPYEVENVYVDGKMAYTNLPWCGAMRGFGVPQIAFAHESQMDILAHELNIDPIDIRLINAFKKGSVTATGQRLDHSVGIKESLYKIKEIRDKYSWSKKKGERLGTYIGVGVGSMWYGIGNTGVPNPSTAQVELLPDGSAILYTGAAEIGQGSDTILLQIASQRLGIAIDRIKLVRGDTLYTTNAGATSASRQTYISGNAVMDSIDHLEDILKAEASEQMDLPSSELIVKDGKIFSIKDSSKSIDIFELVKICNKNKVRVIGEGRFDPPTIKLDPETGQGVPYATYAFASQVSRVEVDTFTGFIKVLNSASAHDVGKAINPKMVKGQITSGVAMGIGMALMEEFVPNKTKSLKDYYIPTSMDMPEIIPIIVEDKEPTGPFGAKGVGEPALIPTAPAIINGIYDAVGVRITHLPANLERVIGELLKKEGA